MLIDSLSEKLNLKADAVPSILPYYKGKSQYEETDKFKSTRTEVDIVDQSNTSILSENNETIFCQSVGECGFSATDTSNSTLTSNESLNFSSSSKECSTHDLFSTRSRSVQTQVNVKSISTQTKPMIQFSFENLKSKKGAIHHYTGLVDHKLFNLTLRSLGPAAYELKYRCFKVTKISIEDQFLITLMKLRRAISDFSLALMFETSRKTIQNIFITWINFMYHEWKQIEIWPNRNIVLYHMPEAFKKSYPTTRIILDGTEIPIDAPNTTHLRQATFSVYKNRPTLKNVVGLAPGGLISYASSAYGGSTSDRQIIERSDLKTMCDPGDSIMVDRGFTVQDIFAPHDVTINIPSFKKGNAQLPGVVIREDKKLANKRVHVERIIGLAKTYKILKNPLPSLYVVLGSEILFVCLMLCNFRPNIMSNIK